MLIMRRYKKVKIEFQNTWKANMEPTIINHYLKNNKEIKLIKALNKLHK